MSTFLLEKDVAIFELKEMRDKKRRFGYSGFKGLLELYFEKENLMTAFDFENARYYLKRGRDEFNKNNYSHRGMRFSMEMAKAFPLTEQQEKYCTDTYAELTDLEAKLKQIENKI